MNDSDMVFSLRKRIFEDWRARRLTWQEVKASWGSWTNFMLSYGLYVGIAVVIYGIIMWLLVANVRSVKLLFHRIILK